MPLTTIDQIPWSKLDTVDGKATKAPAILRGLATGDPAKATKGVAWLFAQVLHQSTPAPSAAAFVPCLIELVALPKQAARWELLALLGDLACGGDHVPFLMTGYTGADPLQVAVAAGRDTFAKALADRDPSARAGAAFVLAWLPAHAARSRKDLTTRLAKEKHPTARASMVMALAVLGAPAAKLAATALTADAAVVQGAGVFALARAGALPAKAKRGLTALVTAGGVDALCWHHGKLGALVLRAVLHAAARDRDVALLVSLLDSDVGHLVAPPVVELMFPGPIDAAQLTASQREILDLLTASPARYGALAPAWKARGLPVMATEARAALGLPPIQSRMDTDLTVGGVKRAFATHLRDACATPANRAALGAALAKGRTAEEVVAFCVESLGLELPGDWAAAIAELLDACGDEIVPVLRTVDLYQEVQWPGGDVITAQAIAAPALLVLAKRDPKLPGPRVKAMINTIPFTREVDVARAAPMLVAILRALPLAHRVAMLAHLHRNTPPWVAGGKRLLEELMVEHPAAELTACVVARVEELADAYRYGRKYENSLFSEGYSPAKLAKLSPGAHPLTPVLTEHLRAYAAVAKAPKLDKALAKFLAL